MKKTFSQWINDYDYKGATILLVVSTVAAIIVYFNRQYLNSDLVIAVMVFPPAVLTAIIIRKLADKNKDGR
ncbi:MAG: hypothetical protein ACOX1F_03195 [Erysipelotrichaceae bacterium]